MYSGNSRVELVTNPYVSTAEPTMGWTLTQFDSDEPTGHGDNVFGGDGAHASERDAALAARAADAELRVLGDE